MSLSVNLVVLGGHLTRDPEVRYTPKGVSVCDFGLAVNKRWKTDDGETREAVGFFDCIAWKGTADAAGQYLKKGSPVLIEGELSYETWQDRETGKNRNRVKVRVARLTFLPRREHGDDDAQASPPARQRPSPAKPSSDTDPSDAPLPGDDDVPF